MIFAQMPTKGKADVVAKLASARAATVVWKVKLTPNYAIPRSLIVSRSIRFSLLDYGNISGECSLLTKIDLTVCL